MLGQNFKGEYVDMVKTVISTQAVVGHPMNEKDSLGYQYGLLRYDSNGIER